MADLDDVSNVLVGIVSGLLYPNGTVNPISLAGMPVRVYPGWPNPEQLSADFLGCMKAGTVNVSIFPLPGERNTTRYLEKWKPVTVNTPTLTLTIAGNQVIIAGTIPPVSNPHNVMVMANRQPYVYAVQPTDSLAMIAAALTAIALPSIPGVVSGGSTITFPPGAVLTAARVGVTGTSAMEIRRQERRFQITIWANSPDARTAVAKIIDPALAGMPFITLPDLFAARLRYVGSPISDALQKQNIYRRDLLYTVEYCTVKTIVSPQIVTIVENIDLPGPQTITVNY